MRYLSQPATGFERYIRMVEDDVILVVEDDPNDVLLIQRAFQKAGLKNELRTVRDGAEAIAYLKGDAQYARRDQFPLPFMILLDLKMPGTDGFEVLQWVRNAPHVRRSLVVVLTSSNQQVDVDKAYELGANSYLVKPVEFDQMVHLIQRFEVYWSEMNRTPSIQPSGSITQRESTLG
jgi:FOG: CheY-like receiver